MLREGVLPALRLGRFCGDGPDLWLRMQQAHDLWRAREMGGRAYIRGLRVTVSLLLNLTANGMTPEEIVEAYPFLETEDVHQALRYAAWLAEEQGAPRR